MISVLSGQTNPIAQQGRGQREEGIRAHTSLLELLANQILISEKELTNSLSGQCTAKLKLISEGFVRRAVIEACSQDKSEAMGICEQNSLSLPVYSSDNWRRKRMGGHPSWGWSSALKNLDVSKKNQFLLANCLKSKFVILPQVDSSPSWWKPCGQ